MLREKWFQIHCKANNGHACFYRRGRVCLAFSQLLLLGCCCPSHLPCLCSACCCCCCETSFLGFKPLTLSDLFAAAMKLFPASALGHCQLACFCLILSGCGCHEWAAVLADLVKGLPEDGDWRRSNGRIWRTESHFCHSTPDGEVICDVLLPFGMSSALKHISKIGWVVSISM